MMERKIEMDDWSPQQQQLTNAKKEYTSPRLVEYGSVAKLTQTGNGSGTDGGLIADMMMQCL